MDTKVKDAMYEMRFCGNYLVQYAAVGCWTEEEHTQTYMMRELMEMAERIASAAAIINNDLEKRKSSNEAYANY